MPDIKTDQRIVLTLDAGGTNFDFAALRGAQEAAEPIRLPSNGHDLEKCIQTIKDGFNGLLARLDDKPAAISFAFPGPADYTQGIIGDLNNLPSFRGGVPLKPILEKEFGLPVFINNDANLFVYGESIAGLLPRVNTMLKEAGNSKRYSSLTGVTLGTGFGGGFVMDGQLLVGDNSLGGEVWLSSSRLTPNRNVEESLSIRAIKRSYARHAGIEFSESPSPKIISAIATGEEAGDSFAARKAYSELGTCLGEVLANLITFNDSLVVIGGGITHSHQLIFPAMMEQLTRPFKDEEYTLNRTVQCIYNLEDEHQAAAFLEPAHRIVEWEGLKPLTYDPDPNLAIGVSKLGTRNATSIGAYAYATAHL